MKHIITHSIVKYLQTLKLKILELKKMQSQ